MRTIFVSPDFPLNRRMRKAVRRGKLQVVREGEKRLSLGGGMPVESRRAFRTHSSPLVCMADNGAESGGGGGGREWVDSFCGELSRLADADKVDAVIRLVEKSIGGDAKVDLARALAESAGGAAVIESDDLDGETGTGFNIVRRNAREIFDGLVQFRVPIFQRDYVWKDEQWEDFWSDASGAKPQYEGGIVLRDIGQKRFEVIDGQQRLTTFCLLVIAALRVLHDTKEEGGFGIPRNHPICVELADAFLVHGGDLSGDIVRANMKIVPHDPQWNGDGLFLSKLMSISARQPGGEFTPYQEAGNTPQIQMKKSVKDFFMENLRGLNLQTPEDVRDFILVRAGGNLVFSRVAAARKEEAHAIFGTLNGRGRALTPAELIKAYFMSFMEDMEATNFSGEWDNIRRALDGAGLERSGNKERGNKELVGFVWSVHVCKFGATPKQRLFRSIAEKVNSREGVYDFFGMMKEQIEVYVQILDPKPEFWGREFGKMDCLRHSGVSKGRSPFIMAANCRKNGVLGEYSKALGVCAAISLRLRVCGHPRGIDHNLPGVVFHRLAHQIWNADQLSADDIWRDPDLGDLYHKNAAFADAFGEFALFSRGKLSKNQHGFFAYLLRTLETHLGGNVERLSNGNPKERVSRCHSGNEARHYLSEYHLRAGQGISDFLTNQRTVHMRWEQRGQQLGEWAAEVPDWRIDRLEDE